MRNPKATSDKETKRRSQAESSPKEQSSSTVAKSDKLTSTEEQVKCSTGSFAKLASTEKENTRIAGLLPRTKTFYRAKRDEGNRPS